MPSTEKHTRAAVTTRVSSTRSRRHPDVKHLRVGAYVLLYSLLLLLLCCLQHGHYTYKASGMQAVRQFVPPNTLRCAAAFSSAPSPQLRQLSCAQQGLRLLLHCLCGVGGSPCKCCKQLSAAVQADILHMRG